MSYNSYRSNRGFYNGPYEKKPQGNYGFHQTYRDKNVGRGSPWYKNGGHRPKGNHSSSNHRTYSDKQSNSRSSSSGGAPNIIESRLIHGTDPMTLKNGADSKFTKLLHHRDFNDLSQAPRGCDNRKNYKIIYDPELDKSLSKSERKIKHRKIRYGGETVLSSDVIDPRKTSTYFSKPNKASKKYPFKQLPQPRFQYDKDSLGPPPRTELIVWDLPSTTSEVYLTNFVKSYGNPIKDLRFISDPENGVSLGISVFKFHGSPHSAMRRAEEFLNTIKLEQPKIDGVEFKVALNDADGKLLVSKEETAKLKLRAFKIRREEEIKKQKKKLELEEIKKEVEEKRLERKSNEINLKEASKEQFSQNGSTSKYQPNTTVLSVRKNNRLISGVFLPKDLRRVIKTSPYILVQNKYVPAKRTSTMDVKRCLSKYDWTSVISDFTGYYIVFNSLKECERCFYNEDGRKFYEYRMFMEMAVPEGCNVSIPSPLPEEEELVVTRRKSHDVVDEAANMLIKDFETFLAKDIRERVIAPIILDLLGHDKYPELLEELRMKDSVKESERVVSESSKNLNHNSVKLTPKSVTSIKRYQSAVLPSFKKKQEALTRTRNSSSKSTLQKRNIIPLQHALNFDNDSDESENDQTSVSTTPAPRLKRAYSSAATSSDEAEKDSVPETKKSKVSRKPFVYDSSSEEEQLEEKERDSIEPDRLDAEKREGSMSDVEVTNEMFQPTPKYFNTVYPEISYLPSDALDLDRLQDLIKDEEDLQLAFKILEDVEDISKVPNIEYFAWKQKQTNADWQEIAEDVDLITELDSHLESTTGSFRSEGYRKIPEADKIGYMPLRRRKLQKPIKTVQQEEDEHPTNTNSIQSSRVNRANNRRFAADVAQSGNETEVLSLNTLTKRKKPVSFARSAIHNWGLYALEPIAAKEMIIEYVGESIRQQVAEHRERSYMKTGIGSSYLFRIDENTVIDATKKGGIARFINHCCNPSCTAKIIKVEGKKRIVIYALKDIEANEELTYDYKFERETNDEERIRCLCGAPGCKGYLN